MTRITLDDIKHLMSEMDQRHADLVHYLFMCNYIDYSDYQFRDEWMIDAYVSIYNAYYQEDSNYLSAVNGYVIEILREWQRDANHKYQKAKHDLYYWLTDTENILSDGKKQNGEYSDLTNCYMWTEWYLPQQKNSVRHRRTEVINQRLAK